MDSRCVMYGRYLADTGRMVCEKCEKPKKGGLNELREQLVEACERKVDYYDVVNESSELVEYGLIIDFLFEQAVGLITGGNEDG